jgi:hypothetical protein
MLLEEGDTFLRTIPGYVECAVIYYNYWSDYEESGWCTIVEIGEIWYEIRGGYSVMVGSEDQGDVWELDAVTPAQALEIVEQFEAAVAVVERIMS